MINKDVFDRIEKICNHNKEPHDVLFALTEELGEYSRAVRIEDNNPMYRNLARSRSQI